MAAAREAPTETTRAPRAEREPRPSGSDDPSTGDIRRFLDRYATAWRHHDVRRLDAMGELTADERAILDYLGTVEELDVGLNVLSIRTGDGEAIVRFTRSDRYRDADGRLVLRESPPIEKLVEATPEGLRFATLPD